MAIRPLIALLGAAAVLLAGCSGSGSGSMAATDSANPGAPTKGGTLTVAIDSDPGQLNPAITTSGGTHTASELIYNGLVDLTPDLKPVPDLAESWDVLDNGALYRFHLRQGVKWHDGAPFTSADVKFTFEQMLLKFHSRTKASVGAALQSIATPDTDTVEFRFAKPYAPLLLQLDVTEAPILPKHLYEGTDVQKNPVNSKPIGTGPYKLVSYKPGAELRFAANRDYYKKDLPNLDQVVMRIIPDQGSQVAALEAGEVDWLFGAPGPDLPRLKSSGNYGFLTTPVNPGGSNCIMTVSFNLDRPMFQDVRLRHALGDALDRDQFLQRVLFGQGKVADAPISSGIPFAHASGLEGAPHFDRGEAERLLDAAGWKREGSDIRTAQGVAGVPDGTPLAFGFTHFPTFAAYAQLLRAQLREVGADVTLKPLEPPVFADTVFKSRNFDTNIISYCNGADPEIGVKRMYVSSDIGPVPFSNSSGYRNPKVDQLFEQARTTVDPAARTSIYRDLQKQIVADLPYVGVVETESTRVFTKRCRDFSAAGHFAETASCSK